MSIHRHYTLSLSENATPPISVLLFAMLSHLELQPPLK
jgi:hypothetical protein